ncbi:hypothetical protein [Micromonospora profundi]|uniref:hypothetical protein n=1 Tax=Micromonospora profundi TaxID=1420889 RepID=UPI0036BD0E55
MPARAPQDTPAGLWTYLLLAVSMLFAAFPLYWMFAIATSDDDALAKLPPAVVPGGEFIATVPLLVMLFIGGRQIVRGIMEGAVRS